MKPIRIIALGLIGLYVASQLQGNNLQQQLQGGQQALPKQKNGNGNTATARQPETQVTKLTNNTAN
jgi:hypothetical protein